MTLYAFRARDHHGVLVTGRIKESAPALVKQILDQQGLIPLTVKPIEVSNTNPLRQLFQRKVSREELLWMTRQFQTMFHAGIGMETILRTIVLQTTNKKFKDALTMIASDIAQGSNLYQSFGKHPEIFDELYLHMLAAGEEAGILDEALKNLADLMEKEIELKAEVKSATLYPKIVIFFLIVASIVTLMVVVPKFTQFYAHYGANLPLPTLLLKKSSEILLHYFWIVFPLWGAGLLLFRRWQRTTRGKFLYDKWRLKLPVFGPLQSKIANARFAHILSAIHRSGISLTRGLPLVAKVTDNEVMVHNIRQIQIEVERGKSLADAMGNTPHFSPLLTEAVRTGEKSGALDELLEGFSRHFDAEIRHTTKNLTTLLEPFLLVVIFGMVAFFVLSIFLPIWNLSQAVLH